MLEGSTKFPATLNSINQPNPTRPLLALDATAAFSIDAITLSDDLCDAWY
jgi:hypothetical protein